MTVSIYQLFEAEHPEEKMVNGEMAIKRSGDKVELLYKERDSEKVHCLTDDKIKVEAINKLAQAAIGETIQNMTNGRLYR